MDSIGGFLMGSARRDGVEGEGNNNASSARRAAVSSSSTSTAGDVELAAVEQGAHLQGLDVLQNTHALEAAEGTCCMYTAA